ncbi:PEP-CTERM sorting domain-containing protein [Cerasicoccus frondis]|uniref:PEP-CTERM sorting domain-containing protein n=1 Tax=Cerasicoccus frondis TaxID=490090 RepID=UPI0028525F43|nr:PEP-CTERM sorting domain-containing protein [Cerasicoccus frondis]
MKQNLILLLASSFMCGHIASANHHMYVYLLEYNSNLYMTMYGTQLTSGSYTKASGHETVTSSNGQTRFDPTNGLFAFLDSDDYDEDNSASHYYSSYDFFYPTTAYDESVDGTKSDFAWGTGDVIYFDEDSTYSAGASSLFRYYTVHGENDDASGSALVEAGYDDSDTMAFFSKATGYTIDDIGLTDDPLTFDYSDYETDIEFTSADGDKWEFSGYQFEVKIHISGKTSQYYYVNIAEITKYELLTDLVEYSGEFSDSQLDEIIDLYLTTSGGDDLIELPGIPEPSTYALAFGILALGATARVRRRKKE